MHRRHFLLSTAAGALRAAARRPNIIVILADDMGYSDVGFNGCKDIPTPNIDSIARTGVRFTNAYVSHPFCSPTRSGLMTGRYQQRYGHENNPRYDPQDEVAGLPLSETTLPQALSAAGYATGHVGKWHLGATESLRPLRRGFRESFGFLGGGHDYFQVDPEGTRREYFIPIQRDGRAVEEKEYLTDAFSREAVSFVRRHARDPFFLYLAFNAPHTPLQVTPKYLGRFAHIADEQRRKYAAMVSAVDDGVGRLLAALQEQKLDSDTLIFFFSDNGGPVGINGSTNNPLRGVKGQLYEGGIRVPFAARWRGRLPEGKQYREPVISLDIFPTAAALAGARLPEKKLDGVDLMPHLLGQTKAPPHQRLFWRTGGGESFAVREGRYKLFQLRDKPAELYDLDADTGETKDLAVAHPEIAARLETARAEWNRELIPPRFESPRPAGKKKA